jgi:hypothetical protein
MTVPSIAEAVTIPVPPEPAPGGNARTFTQDEVADLLNKARQQEKDKLYGRFESQGTEITELKSRLDEIALAREAAEAAKADAQAQAQAVKDKAAKDKAEAEMSAKAYADERSNELLNQLEAIRAEREQERAIFEREREFSELMAYRQQRVAESADDIAPELIDLVTGNTREEVDASVELLKGKTQQLVEAMVAAQQGAAPPRPVAPTGRPNTDPFGGDAQKTYTVDDLKNMPLNEYAAIRTQLLGAASAQYRQRLGNN